MVVCDASKKFTYCFVGYPGSVHDQRVSANSALGHFFPPSLPQQTLSHSGQLGVSTAAICDGAVLRHWCINCNATELQQEIVTSMTHRWKCIRVSQGTRLGCKLARVSSNITASGVLHNITVSDRTVSVELSARSDNLTHSAHGKAPLVPQQPLLFKMQGYYYIKVDRHAVKTPALKLLKFC